MDTKLADLVSLSEFQRTTAHLFPSVESIRWYLRQNGSKLRSSGAVLTIAGRIWICPSKFERDVLELGRHVQQAN